MRSDKDLLRDVAVAILCGGQGSRMKSNDRHKVCFPIAGTPAIIRTLQTFHELGARKIVLVVGALAGNVINCVGKEFPQALYVYQDQQLGTGHAAQIAAAALRNLGHEGPTLITMGDKVIEPRVIGELAREFEREGAELAFVAGPKAQEGVISESGRVVLDASRKGGGAILGIIETRDIQRARILEAVVRFASKRPAARIGYDEILAMGARYIPDEAKRAKALAPLAEKIGAGGPAGAGGAAAGHRLVEALGPEAGRVAVGRKALTAAQVERQSSTVNLSVYLAASEFWNAMLPRLSNDNAQQEFYLTDVVNLAAADKRDWKLIQHVIGDPAEVMAFNSPDELLRIEDVLRRKALATQARARARTTHKAAAQPGARALPRGMLRPAREWLALFEEWPASLRRHFSEIYGPDGGQDRQPIFRRAIELFIERYGPERKAIIVRAPGRINLLGRHVDHRGGAVNVMAIDRDVVFVASERPDDGVTLCSADPRQFQERSFSVKEVMGGMEWEDWLTYVNSDHVKALLARSRGDWSNYVKASLLRLQQKFPTQRIRGFDAAVAGDIPMAAGLSSSSAVVVASAEVAVAFNGLSVSPAELVDLCGEGEWFVGSRGGAADHAAIRMGRRGQLSHIRFLPFRMEGVYDLPENCRVTIAHSGLDARKSDTAKDRFNQKVASYEFGLMLLKDRLPQFAPLLEHVRDLNPRRLNCPVGQIYQAIARVPESMTLDALREALSEPHRRRVEAIVSSHEPPDAYDLRGVLLFGVTECERSLAAPELLKRGEIERFGRLMQISHDGDRVARWTRWANRQRWAKQPVRGRRGSASRWQAEEYRYDCSDEAMLRLCDDLASGDPRRVQDAQLVRQAGAYGCSLPRIDKMVDVISGVEGVYGAQLGGAGLGGCAMILSRPETIEKVRKALTEEYYHEAQAEPLIHVCNPVAGSGPLIV